MDAAFTAEQAEIRRTLRGLLAKRCAPDDVKAAVRTPAGYDQGLWRRLADRMGLSGIALPTEYGGAGCGPAELALACEETGRALLPSPLLPTAILAAPLISELGGPDQRSGLLPRIAAGELTAALALPGSPAIGLGLAPDVRAAAPSGGQRTGGIQARREDGRWRLYGQADHVLGGHAAGLLVVAAHAGGYVRGRTLLFLVEGDAPGLARTRLAALDETRPQARIELRETPAALLGQDGDEDGDVRPALERLGDLAAVVLAAEAVGAADRALSNTVEYVQVREQFGRPIGSFQAVKHRIADLYVRLAAARSAAYYAAWAAGEAAAHGGAHGVAGGAGRPGELPTVAPLALAQGLAALRAVAGESIQLHGALGFTWEHDAHLYFRRAAADELLFGPIHLLRARAAERAGLFARTGGAASDGAARMRAPVPAQIPVPARART